MRQRNKELIKSRDNWKAKNNLKRQRINNLQKKVNEGSRAKGHHYDKFVVWLSILLRVFCRCSYRSVSKIISTLCFCRLLQMNRCPSPNSIRNWVAKVGLYQRQILDIELAGKQRILILDESIRIGQEKQLLILSTPYEKRKDQSLDFSDVAVHYFGGSISWTSDQISELIDDLRERSAMNCCAILSDEDSKLKKASRLQKLPHIADICHATGTCLKKVFSKNADYQCFISDLSSYRSKGVNQDLSYLLPPKQGGKARFLNLHHVVKWSKGMLKKFDQLSVKEQAFFKKLPNHRKMIECLAKCISLAKEINIPLKQKGLSKNVLDKIETLIRAEKKKDKSELVLQFLNKISVYISDYQSFIKNNETQNIPVSSEVIESLFGTYKNLASSDKLVGATNLNFEIDVRCMNIKEINNKLQQALESISMTDLHNYNHTHSADNQIVRRRKFFNNGK